MPREFDEQAVFAFAHQLADAVGSSTVHKPGDEERCAFCKARQIVENEERKG